MAKRPIYDYELKDINKDGKKGFGDTWLGDALGFDGKLGTQGPGMGKSLRGARRDMDSKDKPKGSSKKTSVSSRSTPSKTRPKARPKRTPDGPAGASGTGPGPTQGGAGGPKRATPSKRLDKKGATPKRKEPMFTADNPSSTSSVKKEIKRVTYEQWKGMSRSEREEKGLPTSVLGWQWQKQTGKDKNTEVGSAKRKATAGTARSGMSKGGMARHQKTGKRDYKKSGMFYKSGSPRGVK